MVLSDDNRIRQSNFKPYLINPGGIFLDKKERIYKTLSQIVGDEK